ncbi:NADH-quinone oxidoreductase subunit NuoG [Alphaproteobacteria bacterium]|nr:NADH-quinone oxidoreductase subunit NuoG [Alphaproteobacteria bacterium]
MAKITINNKVIDFQDGMTVMQACELADVEIPRFCYHDKLSIAGNCRMCLVEMEKSPKPIASCAMPAAEGMIIKTNTELVKKARQGVMEFLLINHPLDCPICDQGGECDLQDQALHYGFDKSRYEENKRAVKNKYMGPLVSTIMTRCIHCTRCVRFSTEIAGVDDIGLLGRGENAEITTYLEKTIESELSGNVIDLCPVGALTNKPYAFQSRPWELKKTESVDVFDGMGASIRIDSKGKNVLRVLPRLNEEINEEWINDKTRFAIDGLSRQRLDKPYIKIKDKLEATSWDTALKLVASEIKKRGPENTSAFSGKLTDIESLYSTKNFLKLLNSEFYDCRFDNTQFVSGHRSSYLFNSSFQKIDEADAILIIGSNPKWEAAVLNSRIRKAYLNNNCQIALIGPKINLTYKYTHLSNDISYLNNILNENSDFLEHLRSAKKPLMLIGSSAINYNDGIKILKICAEICNKYNIVNETENGFNVLNQNISRVGALDIGFYSKNFDNEFNNSLAQHIRNTNPVVFLLGLDEINFSSLKDSFIIYIGHHGDEGANNADIILPSPAFPEKTSTFVNIEGRVLQTTKCFNPIGDAKEEWKIFRALSQEFNEQLKFNNLKELRQEIVKRFPHLNQLNTLPNKSEIKFGKSHIINNREIEYNIKNFYMTDSISRASVNMANCTKEILNRVA